MARQRSAPGIFGTQPGSGAHADWMSELCPRLWDVPLHHLAIPGEGGVKAPRKSVLGLEAEAGGPLSARPAWGTSCDLL